MVGSPDARVTVVEYASLTCPHCAEFHTATFARLKSAYVDTGKVRWVLRHYPLDPLAMAAALLVQCAAPDKRFGLASMMFQGQNLWIAAPKPLEPLKQYALLAGLNGAAADACLRDRAHFAAVRDAQLKSADEHDVQFTPAFFIGADSIQGAADYDTLADAIDAALAVQAPK
ncbi:MAG: thioredoxin domain-containing protein [Rhodospirillaceae bacterium]|nr:thioredoxin domain-containing protein [Rhodospirillaceae bacterium]